MTLFATEFPVKPLSHPATFVAEVVGWLRGTQYSSVLEDHVDTDLDKETVYLRSEDAEELRLRQLRRDGNLQAIGFRHDFPDSEGRLWRTGVVVRQDAGDDGQGLIRMRTQCIAQEPGAALDTPRKPYLVKATLQDGWGGTDGILKVTDQPLWLVDDHASLEIACGVTLGKASRHLPVIYVSATSTSNWLLSQEQIEKLAFDLGGVAHVVVEPNRAFSFRLRDKSEGGNAYGGTLGIYLPGRGIVRYFYLGWRLKDVAHLVANVRTAALAIRSQMPGMGWDWTDLQEQALRSQRERDRNRLSVEESDKLFQEEIDNLQDRIRQLEELLAARPMSEEPNFGDGGGFFAAPLAEQIGPELYPGEFWDRLRSAAKATHARADQDGLDARSKAVLSGVVENLPPSLALSELLEDLKRATTDPKHMASQLTALLCRHGYYKKSDRKHIRLEATSEYPGLASITLPKTPGEYRGSKNLRKQIERTLGISKLSV